MVRFGARRRFSLDRRLSVTSPRSNPWLPVIYLAGGVVWVLGSDYLLGYVLQRDPTITPAGTLKGVLFVALSSLLLYAVQRPAQAEPPRIEKSGAALRRQAWRPLAIFLVAALGITFAGRVLYEHQATAMRRQAAAELRSVGELKARQVGRWLDDQLLAVENAGRSPYLAAILMEPQREPETERRARLQLGLDTLRKAEGWTALQLYDVDGHPVAASGAEIPYSAQLRRLARGALVTGTVVKSDVYVPEDAAHGAPVLDFVVALSDERAPGDHNLGVLVARADPVVSLYPIVMEWPSSAYSAQALLYRVGGAGVELLSPHPASLGATGPTRPVQAMYSAALRVAAGESSELEMTDDRGVTVLAIGRPIVGTSWVLLAKMDRDEIYAPLASLARLATALSLASMFATAGLVWLLWRSERRALAVRAAAAEQRAEALSEHFATAGRLINDSVFLLDTDGRILDANDRAEQAYGYSRKELQTMTVQELRGGSEEERVAIQRRFEEIRRVGALDFRSVYVRKDGTPFPAEVSARLLEVNGRSYVQSIIRDTTEREEQARRLAEVAAERDKLLARLRLQFEYMPIGCLIVIPDTGRIEVNPAFERILGYGAEDLNARDPFAAFVPEERREQLRDRLAAIMGGEGPSTTAGEFISKSGRRVTCRWTSTAIRGAEGKPIALMAMCEDISEQVAAERALRASEQRFRVLAEASPVGIFRTTPTSEIVYANARALEITGHTPQNATGYGYLGAIHEEDRAMVRERWQKYLAGPGEGTYRNEYRIVRPDGSVAWVLVQVRTELDEEDALEGFIGTVTDITGLKNAQRELKESHDLLEVRVAERTRELLAAKEEAERADRVKTAFLSTMSHELRTPLNSILGFTDVILQDYSGPLTDGQRRQLTIVRDSATHLRSLIEEVLDISRIEAGQLVLEIGPVDVADMLRRRVAAFEADAARKSIELRAEIAPEVGMIQSDGKRFAQILNNLLANAVKFTDRGSIHVRARRTKDTLEIEVEDTGVGIPAASLGQLFNPFSQVARPGGRVYEGTGLGLAISRRLANALGGDIGVASEPGRGSRFTVTLTMKPPQASEAAA